MQIQVNTDHHIEGSDALGQYIDQLIQDQLGHFNDQLTRIEVFLADENGHKGGDNDLRCTIEARVRGLQPIAVTHHDENIHATIEGAVERISRSVRKTVEKRRAV